MDTAGDRFKLGTVLDNLSAGGLCLRLARVVEPGATLFVVARFAAHRAYEVSAPGVAARVVVLRAEARPGGVWSLAGRFTRHRFLYALTT